MIVSWMWLVTPTRPVDLPNSASARSASFPSLSDAEVHTGGEGDS
jgi:hypothetical protein